MGKLRWYKRDPNAALAGMMELTLEERGAYNTVLDLIYSHDGSVDDDERFIAGWLRCDVRVWRRIRAKLIDLGKLYVDGPSLRNDRADVEVDRGLHRLASAAEAGRSSARKRSAESNKNNKLNPTSVENPLERITTTTREEEMCSDAQARATADPSTATGSPKAAGKSLITEQAHRLADLVRGALAVDQDEPMFFGLPYRAQFWIDKGLEPEAVVIAAKTIAARKRDGPPNLAYLEKAIPSEVAKLTQPAAEVVQLPAQTIAVHHQPRAVTVRDQAQQETQDVLRQLREFASGGSGGSGADPRLLRHNPGK